MQSRETYKTRITLLQKMQTQYDEMAWEEFVDTYGNYIYTIINSMKISEHDAEDLRQQIFLKLWQKLPEIDLSKINRFRSYLAVMVKNCVKDFFKKRSRESQRIEGMARESGIHEAESVSTPDIDRIVEDEWHSFIAAKAFQNVSEFFSEEAISLFKETMSGRNIKDVASQLDIPLRTAYRTKQRIKDSLVAEIEALNQYLG